MMLSQWLSRRWPRPSRPAAPLQSSRRRSVKLSVEQLEDRLAPAVVFSVPDFFDQDTWTVTGDGDGDDKAFFGTPFTPSFLGLAPTFTFDGNVSVPDNTEIQAATPNGVAIVIYVTKDLTLGQNVFINFAATNATPGPGGGQAGSGGAGGAGGQGSMGGRGGAGGEGTRSDIGAQNGGFGNLPLDGFLALAGGLGLNGTKGFNQGSNPHFSPAPIFDSWLAALIV
ncbi:MAG: hypothetical protein JNM56_08485 [Planctomycetia bacterium]|nr:hypothetical protein [Planctomycetia bacterium]